MRFFYYTFLLLLLTACNQEQIKVTQEDAILLNKVDEKKITEAFDNAEDNNEKLSQWNDTSRTHPLDLVIIGPVYDIDSQKKTQAYKKMKSLLEQIYESPKIMNLISGSALRQNFNNIEYIPYRTNTEEHDKFNAVLSHKNNSKEILNDILREYNDDSSEKNSMSIAIKINYDDLKNGYFTIEGYKTLKQRDKERNSYYYSLTKKINPSSGVSDEDITNALLSILQLDIPPYQSIDRSESLKKGVKLNIAQKKALNNYNATSWTYEPLKELDTLKQKLQYHKENPVPQLFFSHNLKKEDVVSVATSLDENMIVFGSQQKVDIYKNFNYLKSIQSNIGKVTAVDINKHYIAAGGDDTQVNIYTIKDSNKVMQYNSHKRAITKLKFIPNTNFVLSGSKDALKLWDINTGKTIYNLKHNNGEITALAISQDGKYAVAADAENSIALWDLTHFKKLWAKSNLHNKLITGLSISADSKYILSSSWDKKVLMINLNSGNVLKKLTPSNKAITDVKFIDNSKYFLVVDKGSTIELYNTQSFVKIERLQNNNMIPYSSITNFNNYALAINTHNALDVLNITPIVNSKNLQKIQTDIENISSSIGFNNSKKYQKLLLAPISKNDIDILHKYNYIDFNILDTFTKEQVKQITTSLKLDFIDPVITVLYSNIYRDLTQTSISKKSSTFILEAKENYELDNLYFTTKFNLDTMGYKKVFEKNNVPSSNDALLILESR